MGSSTPKQFLYLGGIPILQRSVERFLAAEPDAKVVIVLPERELERWKELCLKHAVSFAQTIAFGGMTRFHSVRNALEKVPDGAVVSIHDGVRPLVAPRLVREMLDRMQAPDGPQALIPVVPVTDTLRSTSCPMPSCFRVRLMVVEASPAVVNAPASTGKFFSSNTAMLTLLPVRTSSAWCRAARAATARRRQCK